MLNDHQRQHTNIHARSRLTAMLQQVAISLVSLIRSLQPTNVELDTARHNYSATLQQSILDRGSYSLKLGLHQ